MSTPANRFTLRDLPLPAKLVVSTFLISVGLGYLWAMAQIHFKHAGPGRPMPGLDDIVARFSGVPWPLEPKPQQAVQPGPAPARADGEVANLPGIKVKSLLEARCIGCHGPGGEKSNLPLDKFEGLAKYLKPSTAFPIGQLHRVLTNAAGRQGKFDKENMTKAFFEKSEEWPKKPGDERQKAEKRGEVERLALVAWVEAGAPLEHYSADAIPLVDPNSLQDIAEDLRTKSLPLPKKAAGDGKPAAVDKWKVAKGKQLSVDALTQSTHAHLLTFSLLWAATGLVFAFTSHSVKLRTLVAPVVLIFQVLDIACWWLARLDGIGPYFALAILGTGAVVGLGLGAQITLSLFNMYGGKGKAVIVLLFAIGAAGFGLVYVKVIDPQLQEEKRVAGQAGG